MCLLLGLPRHVLQDMSRAGSNPGHGAQLQEGQPVQPAGGHVPLPARHLQEHLRGITQILKEKYAKLNY